jgi:hypothetical protein
MVRQNHCLGCEGSGVCQRCGGWGRRWSTCHGRTHREPCPHCSGVGACRACDGSGRSFAGREGGRQAWRWPAVRWPSVRWPLVGWQSVMYKSN